MLKKKRKGLKKFKDTNTLQCDIKFKMGNITFDEWDNISLDDVIKKLRRKYF